MKEKMVSKIVLILLLIGTLTLVLNTRQAQSQPPATEWDKTYGGPSRDFAWSIVQTSDGGYAVAGDTSSFGAGYCDFWLVKADSSGNMEWSQTYGGLAFDSASSVIQTSEGGYALLGVSESHFWFVKTDASGNMQWNKRYARATEDWARSIVQTSDGGYALAGFTEFPGNRDSWLIKTDSAGNTQWNKIYDRAAYSMIQTSDGGYALAGEGLVKTDAYGNMQWNTFPTTEGEANSIIQTMDGGYLLAGITRLVGAGGADFYVVKTDSAGNTQWSKTYGGTSDDAAGDVVQTSDGGYMLAGYTFSFGVGSMDGWLVKTDSSGNMEWSQTYGGTAGDSLSSIIHTSDGGYALAGTTMSFGSGWGDFWLIKLSSTPPPPVQPVGGEWVPINKLQLLAPSISLASTMAIAVSFVGIRRIKKRQD